MIAYCTAQRTLLNAVWWPKLEENIKKSGYAAAAAKSGVVCHFLLQCMKVKSKRKVAQSCPILSDPMDHSLSGSSIHGIFQPRVLEWGAIAFSESGDIYIYMCVCVCIHTYIYIYIYKVIESLSTQQETKTAYYTPKKKLIEKQKFKKPKGSLVALIIWSEMKDKHNSEKHYSIIKEGKKRCFV